MFNPFQAPISVAPAPIGVSTSNGAVRLQTPVPEMVPMEVGAEWVDPYELLSWSGHIRSGKIVHKDGISRPLAPVTSSTVLVFYIFFLPCFIFPWVKSEWNVSSCFP